MVKEKMKPSVDFCDGCKYLHGDEDGENYYQFCELANGCSEPETYINIKDLASCPDDSIMAEYKKKKAYELVINGYS